MGDCCRASVVGVLGRGREKPASAASAQAQAWHAVPPPGRVLGSSAGKRRPEPQGQGVAAARLLDELGVEADDAVMAFDVGIAGGSAA